ALYLAVAWLLPALALSTATLALSARLPAAAAAGSVVALWLGAVFTTVRATGSSYAAFGAVGQTACLALIVISIVLISGMHRRAAFDLRRES
nr:zf-HC2 domain-containing protein [Sporichthyaceae bacterium]